LRHFKKKFVFLQSSVLVFLGTCSVFAQDLAQPSTSHNSQGVSLPAEGLFQRAQGWVFPLKTALSAQSPKKSYGTAFVIDASGVLATNFHVVADALHEPEKYQLYLEVSDTGDGQPHGALTAEVIGFDIIHDLALVKVNRSFSGAFSLASEGDLMPAAGEKLWSLGKPLDLKLSLAEGTFNGEIALGDYAEYFLSTQLNPGMSGGPTLDSLEIVRGVNFAIHRKGQNVSFVVPGRYLKKLVNQTMVQREARAQSIPKGPSERKKVDASEMAQQISVAGTTLVDTLVNFSADPQHPELVMGDAGLRFSALPTDFRCWQNQEDLSKRLQSSSTALAESWGDFAPTVTVTKCATPFHLTIADDLGVGGIELKFISLKQKKPMRSRSDIRIVSQQIAGVASGMFQEFIELRSGRRKQPALGRMGEICRSVPLRKGSDSGAETWEVRFCVDEYAKYAPLKELALRVVGADPSGEAFVMSLQVQAFDSNSIQKLTHWAIQGIQWDRSSNRESLSSPSRTPASLSTGGEQ